MPCWAISTATTLSLTYPFNGSYAGMQLVDLNHDGKLDVLNGGDGDTFSILLNLGNGTFAPQQNDNLLSSNAYGIAAADLRGIGKLDIISEESSADTVEVLLHR